MVLYHFKTGQTIFSYTKGERFFQLNRCQQLFCDFAWIDNIYYMDSLCHCVKIAEPSLGLIVSVGFWGDNYLPSHTNKDTTTIPPRLSEGVCNLAMALNWQTCDVNKAF